MFMIMLIWDDVDIYDNVDMRWCWCWWWYWYEMMLMLMMILRWNDVDDEIEMRWCWCWWCHCDDVCCVYLFLFNVSRFVPCFVFFFHLVVTSTLAKSLVPTIKPLEYEFSCVNSMCKCKGGNYFTTFLFLFLTQYY